MARDFQRSDGLDCCGLMTWTIFVPRHAESDFRRATEQSEIQVARSWSDLEQLVENTPTNRVVVDPTADGTTNVTAVLQLVRKFPRTPLVTCVTRSPKGLLAAAALGGYGLRATLLDSGVSLKQIAESQSVSDLARAILSWAERSLALLPDALRFTTVDLFERPCRYSSGSDLALASGLSLAGLYRHFEMARLGTPKKVVVVAKMVHAYHHLRNSKRDVQQISELVGLRPRILAQYSRNIFGVLPTRLRVRVDSQEILHSLLDWLYRPQPAVTRT
jgi:AraC-like DNA-binding protein